jgi:hypothetical protein
LIKHLTGAVKVKSNSLLLHLLQWGKDLEEEKRKVALDSAFYLKDLKMFDLIYFQ